MTISCSWDLLCSTENIQNRIAFYQDAEKKNGYSTRSTIWIALSTMGMMVSQVSSSLLRDRFIQTCKVIDHGEVYEPEYEPGCSWIVMQNRAVFLGSIALMGVTTLVIAAIFNRLLLTSHFKTVQKLKKSLKEELMQSLHSLLDRYTQAKKGGNQEEVVACQLSACKIKEHLYKINLQLEKLPSHLLNRDERKALLNCIAETTDKIIAG